MPKIIIQKENKEFTDEFSYNAWYSFKYLNWLHREEYYKIKFISFKDINTVSITKDTICVGSLEFMHKIFDKLRIKKLYPINIPESLISYCNRKIWTSTKKDLNYPIFIKPLKEHKLFQGTLLEKECNLSLLYPEIKEDTELLCSEPVNFISEYRTFVYKNELVSLKHYYGDVGMFPNINIIKQAILDYKDSPIAYVIDFGITDKGDTILVEVNDFYSCGTYGFTGEEYAKMLVSRWKEIITKNI